MSKIFIISTLFLSSMGILNLNIFSSIHEKTWDNSMTNIEQPSKPKVTFKDVEPLLQKYTCIVCHNETKKMIGPSYKDIAKRNYTEERILQLIYKPEPSNWPDYPAPMVPMTQVKKVDGLKIAAWINTLK